MSVSFQNHSFLKAKPYKVTPNILTLELSNYRITIMNFKVIPENVLKILLFTITFLVLASTIAMLLRYFWDPDDFFVKIVAKLFYLNWEMTIPTWYASITLFICSALLAIITLAKKTENEKYWLHWALLSLIFAYLSIDDASGIHEKMGKCIPFNTSGIFYFSWVIVGIPIAFFVLLVFIKFFLNLPENMRFLFLLSGVLFVGGAIGMELVDGWYASINGTDNLVYDLLTTIEETLEMLGVAVFIYSLLSYIKINFGEIVIHFSEK